MDEEASFDAMLSFIQHDDRSFFDNKKRKSIEIVNEEAKLEQLGKNLEANDATLIKLTEDLKAITKEYDLEMFLISIVFN